MMMTTTINKFALIAFASIIALLCVSCGGSQNNGAPQETLFSGELKVYCDNDIYPMIKEIMPSYDSAVKQAKVTIIPVSSREAMKQLLSGNAKCVLLGREYLRDEDSLMKVYGVEPHQKFKMASDGLVFFTRKDFPLDTISDELLKNILNNKAEFSQTYPKLNVKAQFCSLEPNSSIYQNIKKFFTGKSNPKLSVEFTTIDSLKNFVANNKGAIGIAYLSHTALDTNFKNIKISWKDSLGNYKPPYIVHQSRIVMGDYPYRVPLYAYVLENKRNLAWGFASFLATEAVAQRKFLNLGIVPEYAKIVLHPDE